MEDTGKILTFAAEIKISITENNCNNERNDEGNNLLSNGSETKLKLKVDAELMNRRVDCALSASAFFGTLSRKTTARSLT